MGSFLKTGSFLASSSLEKPEFVFTHFLIASSAFAEYSSDSFGFFF